MPRNLYHPKAYLVRTRNVKAGLASRTKMIVSMEKEAKTAAEISKMSTLSYACVAHHLRLLREEKIVLRSGTRRRYAWTLTEFGQQKL